MQSAAAVMLLPLLVFPAYTAALSHKVFNGQDNPQKLPLPLEGSEPTSNIWSHGPS